MTPVLLVTPVLLFGLTLAFIVRVVIKLQSGFRKEELTREWVANFSISIYQPMQRLFSEEDFSFLSRQPGFDLDLYKKFRRERLRIFRQYMNRLIGDYNRLHEAARMTLAATSAASSRDQSEMLARLIKLRFDFALAVVQAEANYLLCRLGFRTLAVRAVVLRLGELSAQVSAIYATETV